MTAKALAIKILSVEYIGGYVLKILFSDKKEQTVDFEPFLRNSVHSEIRKFLKPQSFKRFKVLDGELMWGDFDLIFPIMDIYQNRLEHHTAAISKPGFSSRAR
jgi:hypothetical protein